MGLWAVSYEAIVNALQATVTAPLQQLCLIHWFLIMHILVTLVTHILVHILLNTEILLSGPGLCITYISSNTDLLLSPTQLSLRRMCETALTATSSHWQKYLHLNLTKWPQMQNNPVRKSVTRNTELRPYTTDWVVALLVVLYMAVNQQQQVHSQLR